MRLLDIVIPSYNRPRRLFTLLETGLKLGLEDAYFVVIDDGSVLAERIEGVGTLTTQQVCQHFNSKYVVYLRNPQNLGLARSWVAYYEKHCDAKYTLSVVDKDVFVDAKPIQGALRKLEQDDALCMVVIPMMQQDRTNEDLLIRFSYDRMSGRAFISRFVHDPSLQHCTSYGVKRVRCIRQAGVPRNLQLTEKGLDDGFGIDIDLVLLVAAQGDVDFEREPHVKRITMDGATERYPLTFAYSYYQYAKRALADLSKRKLITFTDVQCYVKNWLLLILRGLVVAYKPVHGTELERGTTRIRGHLTLPIHLYVLLEVTKYRIKPSREMLRLYIISLRLLWRGILKLQTYV